MVLVCLVFAFVLFVIAGFWGWRNPPAGYHYPLIASGLAFWVLAQLVPMLSALR